eukprot:399818-Rhodomonas_salina.1
MSAHSRQTKTALQSHGLICIMAVGAESRMGLCPGITMKTGVFEWTGVLACKLAAGSKVTRPPSSSRELKRHTLFLQTDTRMFVIDSAVHLHAVLHP